MFKDSRSCLVCQCESLQRHLSYASVEIHDKFALKSPCIPGPVLRPITCENAQKTTPVRRLGLTFWEPNLNHKAGFSLFSPSYSFTVMSISSADLMDVEVVLDMSRDVECDVDISTNAVIGVRRLVESFDSVGIHQSPLPRGRLWPTGPCVLVRFSSLTVLLCTFPFVTVAALVNVATNHNVHWQFSGQWRKSRFVDELSHHQSGP
jgi:hypothetical protein